MNTPGGVRVWQEEPDVLRVRLDRPESRNAQTPQTWADLVSVADQVTPETRFVILDGTAPDFSAGLDRALFAPGASDVTLLSLAQGTDAELDTFIQAAQAAFRVWRSLDAHVVAVVQGNAIGAGFQLALAADLVVVHPEAHLVLRETALGIIPDLGAAAHLHPTLGYSRALALTSGIPISGSTAYAWGLATVLSESPEEATQVLLDQLRAANPGALRAAKRVMADVSAGAEPWVTERHAQMQRMRDLIREFTQ
ncbi:MAG: enoyl-CoA hydratase/isomerase family protein [Actinobacteria bacterium]|nr:enoyl-CoA hydratase/isomerase family protein [Actinomycetota bacterium]